MEWTRGERLGKGGFGQVFMAIPSNSNLPRMAVKSVSEENVGRLIAEHRILRHFVGDPGVIQFYGDIGVSRINPGGPITYDLLLEYAARGSLSDMIANLGEIPESFVRVFTRSLLEGLFSIHSVGFTHCDIKPANILVFPGESPLKIADFGLAVETDAVVVARRRAGGTLRYMPPEAVASGKVSPAMDIWALGCTVLEMLTGKVPWEAIKDKRELRRKIGKGGQPEIPEWVSEEGKDFLRKCFMLSFRRSAELLLSHPFVTGGRMEKKKQRSATSAGVLLQHQTFQQGRLVLQC